MNRRNPHRYDVSPSKAAPTPPIHLNNRLACRLGLITLEVGRLGPAVAGDEIDRGLIMQKRLAKAGFHITYEGPEAL